MRKMLTPSARSTPRSSASALALIRDPRVLHVYPDHTIFKPIPVPAIEVPLTVVVTVDGAIWLPDALRSLIAQDYTRFQVIVVCMSPKHREQVERLLAQYQKFLPTTRLFSMQSAGWPADALNGIRPAITTGYWSWLHSSDVLHPKALAAVANAILTDEADYYSTCRYKMQVNKIVRPVAVPVAPSDNVLWSGTDFPYDRLITYRLSALARIGGFVSYDRYPGDTAWIAAYRMKEVGCTFSHIPLAVYFERAHKDDANGAITPVAYRQALLLQHWPAFYVEEPDDEAGAQALC